MLEKWTGTDADRRDMRNLKLTQAVRVRPLPIPIYVLRP
jgi:hypothetical protein